MAQLGKFLMLTFNHWMGLTKDNHIGAVYRKEPQRATNLMVLLLAYHRGKTLENYLRQFPTKEFDTDDDYFWEVIGSHRRNIPLVEARDANGNVIDPTSDTMIGVAGDVVYLVFAEDWFADGNVIVGEKNELYPFRVLGAGRNEGTNTVYKTTLMGSARSGIPAEELALGKRFSVEYSPVERELSREVGDIRFTSPIAMRNEFSQIRIKHKVPGNKLGLKLAVGIPFVGNAGNKKVQNMWMQHVDYQLEEQFSDEKNNLIMYGRSNRNRNGEYLDFGKSGNVIKQGAGLREQMEVANTILYNRFSLKLIEDAIYNLSSARLNMNDRIFVLRTGERGAALFHKAVQDVVSGWTMFVYDNNSTKVIQRVNSPLHTNALSAGYQFVEFRAPNGVILRVEVDPFYDDPVRNKISHPEGGVAESYRFDIMYMGTQDQPNIQLASVKNQPELRGYQWGFRNPFTGAMNNMNMSYDEDSAVIHKMWMGGVMVLDPTRIISLIPNVLAA